MLFAAFGRHVEAEASFRQTLALGQRRLGNDSLLAARSWCDIAISCLGQGESNVSLEHLHEASRIYKVRGAQGSIDDLNLQCHFGQVYFNQQRFLESLACYESGLAIGRKFLVPNHPALAAILEGISMAKAAVGDAAAASEAVAACSEINRRSQTYCGGPGCTLKLRLDGAPLDVCVKCRRTFYCGKACQTADWKREGGHRAECKALIAAAAAAAKAAAAAVGRPDDAK